MFSRCIGLVVIYCLTCVECGYIDVHEDYALNEIPDDDGDKENKTSWIYAKLDATDSLDQLRALDAKDALTPLMMAAVLKVFTLIPMVLGTLGMIAGFSVGASKVALLLAAAVALYTYLTEQKLLIPFAKNWGYLPHELPVLDLHGFVPQDPLQYLHQPRIVLRRTNVT